MQMRVNVAEQWQQMEEMSHISIGLWLYAACHHKPHHTYIAVLCADAVHMLN